jgi:hypothetical protein
MGPVTREQKRRYGFAAGLIVLGFACTAASTGTVGGALATVFVGVGMLLFLVFLFRDLGLTIDSKPRRRIPDPPPAAAAVAAADDDLTPPAHANGGRPRPAVRPAERARGDR